MVFAHFSVHTAYVFYSNLIIEKLSENGTPNYCRNLKCFELQYTVRSDCLVLTDMF